MMKSVAFFLATVLAVFLQASPAAAEPNYNIYLTAKAQDGVPLFKAATTFSCQEKIYGVVEIDNPDDSARHILYATWRNPAGEDQEVTKYPFQMIDGHVRIWVWLKLHRDSGYSLFQGINPTGGLEEFAGDWELQLSIDDKPVATKKFEMIC